MRALVVVALAGCSQWFGLDQPEHTIDATPIDGAPLCLGTGAFEICLDSAPTTPLSLDGTLDTSSNACPPFKTKNGTSVCVVAGSSVTVANTFHAQGALPLVVFAVTDRRHARCREPSRQCERRGRKCAVVPDAR